MNNPEMKDYREELEAEVESLKASQVLFPTKYKERRIAELETRLERMAK